MTGSRSVSYRLLQEVVLRQSRFFIDFSAHVQALGGYHNAHLHLDRAHTLSAVDSLSEGHLALAQKHALISDIHCGQHYAPDQLMKRLNDSLDTMVACNTRRADSVIDVTDDGLGLRALEAGLAISDARKSEIDFRVAAYNPLGFRNDAPARWTLFEEATQHAHFIGALPERDDQIDYPDHIGYEESCARLLDLAKQQNKDIQIHTDQVNHPNENGTERVLDVITRENLGFGTASEPKIWVVHMISPSTYDEGRWQDLVARLLEQNIGVISCPSGAIGMRQLRPVMTPTGNSIARVLELCAAGVQVRLGCDNIADMLSPSTTADLTDEVFLLSAALRFYDVGILAKLACGQRLVSAEIAHIKRHLEANDVEMAQACRRWGNPGATSATAIEPD